MGISLRLLALPALLMTALSARAAEVCHVSRVMVTPDGLAALSQKELTRFLQSPMAEKIVSDAIAKNPFIQNAPVHKALLGMDVRLKNFSNEVIQSEISLRNSSLKKLEFGDVQMKCTEKSCRIHVPIRQLQLQTDFKIRCIEESCKGKDLIALSGLGFSIYPYIGPNAPESAYVEYDVILAPEKSPREAIHLDPKSAKFHIRPSATDLRITQSDEEQKQVDARYRESYEKYRRQLEAAKAGNKQAQCLPPNVPVEGMAAANLLRDMDDVHLFATVDSLKPKVANMESYAYFMIGKMALQSEESGELHDYLAATLGPPLAEVMNQSVQDLMPADKKLEFSVPAVTPSQLFLQPDLNHSKNPMPDTIVQLRDTYRDDKGNVGVKVRSCHEPNEDEALGKKGPGPGFTNDLKTKGYDLAGAVSVEELNGYLARSFSDPKRNNVYFEDTGGAMKYKVRFNDPPQLKTVLNPKTGKQELFMTLDITQSSYRFRATRDMPSLPFLSSTVKGKIGIIFDPATRELKFQINRADLGFSPKDPLDLISEVLSHVPPIYLLKTAILNGVVIPGLNGKTNFKDIAVENFSIQELTPSADGQFLLLAAKVAGKKTP